MGAFCHCYFAAMLRAGLFRPLFAHGYMRIKIRWPYSLTWE